MEYDSRPDNLIHEAVEEAVNANPSLALEPYYQMKAAALILSKKLIEVRGYECIFEAETPTERVRQVREELRWLEGSTSDDIIPYYIKERMKDRYNALLIYWGEAI